MKKNSNMKMVRYTCFNCTKRLFCKEKENYIENENNQNLCCNLHIFDEEALSCDSCLKKDDCGGFLHGASVCDEFILNYVNTCSDCFKMETCKNFIDGGKICDKFKEATYSLTDKGIFVLAYLGVCENKEINFDVLDNFFTEFNHNMAINGLYKDYGNGFLANIKYFFWRLSKRFVKNAKNSFDIFRETAQSEKYKSLFSDEHEMFAVYNKFVVLMNN